jgi:hypothetical protein
MTELSALLTSMAVEGPVAYVLVRAFRWRCRGPLAAAAAVMLATAATHPQFWTASLWLYPRIGYWSTIAIAEALVILVEAAIIAWSTGLEVRRALAVSAVANVASAAAGIGLSLLSDTLS